MTEELYYTSAYITEFVAKVVSCMASDKYKGKYEVELDKTAFFPEQGGQGCDSGVLTFGKDRQEARVEYVGISSASITHIVDREIAAGTEVYGTIDWKHRFSNMQQHTGEHIFSGLVNSRFGYDNVGFHLSDSEVTMDYNGPINQDEIRELEMKANEIIWNNLEVLCEFPEEDKLKEIPYRSKKELSGDVRIVTIPGVDICACCAPHVLRTGEIGLLKVVGLQNYKGGVRVNILCGKRALEYLSQQTDIVSELSSKFTTSAEKVLTSVNKLSEENAELKGRLTEAMDSLIEYEVKEIDPELESVVLVKNGLDNNSMRKLVNLLTEAHKGYCGVFSGSSDGNFRYIVGSSGDGKDCREVANLLRNEFGAKGGGSAQMVQGSLATDDIDKIKLRLGEM